MAESLSNWLAVREPADFEARSATLTREVTERLGDRRPLRILDLGTGTGSNVRYLAGVLPAQQHWLLVDRDRRVVGDIPSRMAPWAASHGYHVRTDGERLEIAGRQLHCAIERRCLNLGALDDTSIFFDRHLVTAAALLDLVSESWLDTLASRCRDTGAIVLFTLSYNGRSRCTPAEPEDNEIRELLNRHQRANDKGFGPAAGPEAVDCAARSFTEVGYDVRREASDWILRPDQRELQRQLIEGWAEAALELMPGRTSIIHSWLTRRLAHVEANRSHIVVHHEDLAAWPASHSQSDSNLR